MSTSLTHQQLAELLGGELIRGDPNGLVTGLNSIGDAVSGDVTFLGNSKYVNALKSTRATAVLVSKDFRDFADSVAYIAVENPTLAFSAVIRHFGPPIRAFVPGVHPTANVAASVVFDPARVCIGPNVVIEDAVLIGNGTHIQAGAFVGHGTRIGTDCMLHPNCSIRERCVIGDRVTIHCNAAIGADGFGFQFSEGRHVKIEQVGIVQIDDDVEIGACTTIDRARFGRTWIGAGTKIDNLVQIGHNVILGKHCIVCGQVGIAGSTRIGNHVTLAGQVGVSGHLEIVDQVTLLAQAGVLKDIAEPGAYIGHPAVPAQEGRKSLLLASRLPDMADRIRQLERKLAEFETRPT
ncbi:MAG: UDP-3-O-(3-hydroxymyristoyl)glucosamine N-acyltransferase [Prosthecobacter sp.]|nr:UDP-3-O-(3-hydroxymyristoyl)glucosamine N-acyltransferase [Prosthecobacter sp.]